MAEVLYTSISNRIEEKIKTGELPVNQKLPSERLLASEFGVSRTVIREALKVLAEKGLIKAFVGRGNYVSLPENDFLIDKFETAIDNRNINIEDIVEARQIIESAVVKRAARCASDQDIAKLKAIYDEMDNKIEDLTAFTELDAHFHLQIAACTGNELLGLISKTLNNVTDRNVLFANYDVKLRKNAQKEHKNIIKAIEERDETEGEDAIFRHIKCFGQHIK